jgi:hypothetical protein
VLDSVVFTDLNLRSVFTGSSRLAEVVSAKFAARPRVCVVQCETKQAANLSVHQDGGRRGTGLPEIPETETIIAEISISCQNEQIP